MPLTKTVERVLGVGILGQVAAGSAAGLQLHKLLVADLELGQKVFVALFEAVALLLAADGPVEQSLASGFQGKNGSRPDRSRFSEPSSPLRSGGSPRPWTPPEQDGC